MTVDVRAINGDPPVPDYSTVPWYGDLLACHRCGCRDEALRVVPGYGPVDAEFLVVGQNPGAEEDEFGVPFVGRGGAELDGWFHVLRIARRKVIVTNIVKCHTENNRVPRAREIKTCEQAWMQKELETFTNVKVVIPLGRPALLGLVGKQEKKFPEVMEPWWMLTSFGERTLHLLPLPHPAYLLRTPSARPTLHAHVLPWVRNYLETNLPEVLARAHP